MTRFGSAALADGATASGDRLAAIVAMRRQGQQFAILRRVAVGMDGREPAEIVVRAHAARLLRADALSAFIAAGQPSVALLQRGAEQGQTVCAAPGREIGVERAR